MSDSDSFINEVTEEVRRDRLYGLLRKWGWLAALVVVAIVGGAAYLEYQRAQQEAVAQSFGDALLAGLDAADPEARLAALDAIETDSPQATMLLALLASSERANAGDAASAAADLRAAAETPELDRRYRDLALLRAEMLSPSEPSQARLILGAIAEPGAPYAGLAQEQLALLALREGNVDEALEGLRRIEAGAQSTGGLQQRASQLIVAIEAGAELLDVSPVVVEPDEPADEPADEPTPDGADDSDATESEPDAEAAPEEDAAPAVSE